MFFYYSYIAHWNNEEITITCFHRVNFLGGNLSISQWASRCGIQDSFDQTVIVGTGFIRAECQCHLTEWGGVMLPRENSDSFLVFHSCNESFTVVHHNDYNQWHINEEIHTLVSPVSGLEDVSSGVLSRGLSLDLVDDSSSNKAPAGERGLISVPMPKIHSLLLRCCSYTAWSQGNERFQCS